MRAHERKPLYDDGSTTPSYVVEVLPAVPEDHDRSHSSVEQSSLMIDCLEEGIWR